MSVIFRFPGYLCLGGLIAFTGALWGQSTVTPQGGEFSILGSLPGDQVWPSVSLSPTGGCVTWQANVLDKSGGGLGGTLLNTSFEASRPVRVNKTVTGIHLRPKVQLLANDNTIFVWESTAGGVPGIYARISTGKVTKTSAAFGTNFSTGDVRVNTYIKGQQVDPAVAALPDGSAINTWSSFGEDGSMFGVYARRLKPTGVGATAKEFQVNQFASYNQRNPAVAALPNGTYVITWISEQERRANSMDVYARVFTDAGVPLTDEIPVNSGAFPCSSPAVAPTGDGGFTVVWAQKNAFVTPNNGTMVTSNSWDVWGRPFSAVSGTTCAPLAADFAINTYLFGDQYQPKIAAGPSGSLVVWTSLGEDGSREGVYGRFLAGGTAVSGPEFRVNTTTISQQMHPSVAWDGVGRFLVVWTSFTPQSGFDLFGQSYVLSSAP